MHRAGICHRDLKCENLVLDADFNLKVIDLGLAIDVSGERGSGFCKKEFCGTRGYKAPEIVVGIGY